MSGIFVHGKPATPKTLTFENRMHYLSPIQIETTPRPDSTVILLHGLGADGNDFAPIIPELQLPDDIGIRFIFPHAPSMPVTINGGFVMPAWYDILEMNIDRKVDHKQLMASAGYIDDLIEEQVKTGIQSERIILAGFSQGGAVAYQCCLSSKRSLGGLLAMSTYFATSDDIQLSEANRNIPIEIHHGTHDPVVPEALGKKAHTLLQQKGYAANYRSYPMEHSLCLEQIQDISAWLQQTLKK